MEIAVKNQQVVAAVILLAVAAWMFIPHSAETLKQENNAPVRVVVAIEEGQPISENPDVLTVRAATIRPQIYVKQIRVRGRTQAFRHVQVRMEQAGRIVSDPIARGARVKQGDLLCEIAVDNRDSDLLQARSRREQATFEYDAALDLQGRGLQSEVVVAQLKAALASSSAAVSRAELALKNIRLLAPFDGIVETRNVEIGDLLNIGDVCASVLDDKPMLLVGLVPEQDVSSVSVGARVSAKLLDSNMIAGVVTYLARAADAVSRSYRIEVEVDGKYTDIRAGTTVELMVDAMEISAHLIPSSALTLDDEGAIGVKLIGAGNRILHRNIEIVGDSGNQLDPGIWVTGLSGTVNLVTLGQEIVFPGQVVEGNFDWAESPAPE
ncbi:MAG TPA: efflux RND transporter periplasmic adaptor subunit [Gammaproteobacteria bacterium]|mgnify:FL=1|jgi:multidrug efflux system membrane fusion protein|nr:efflux RND transporter periplasmic adaptor subunit [Gammaproteobacteria bacterium]HIL63608.1 efflux RND transporter periplasmic adaptor subunit [Porticoccaceae bacterium]|tara:strand:- start:595 stop:1734 length:1140 start_codon:yes stop_codon:yes gene_type:complete